MKVRLAFGKAGIELELADDLDVTVIEPSFLPGVENPEMRIRECLQDPIGSPPLASLVGSRDRVGIIISDITRPSPSHLLLPALVETLSHLPPDNISIFVALGTHRPNTKAELHSLLGRWFGGEFSIVQNDASDITRHAHLGRSAQGHDIWLHSGVVDCDLRILTGFLEPHFFAGFSGGGKAIMPGMAGQATVLANHSAAMIAHPNSTWGVTDGNPIWEEIQEVADSVGPNFLLNVTLNREKRITGIYSGDVSAAYQAGCRFVCAQAMIPVREPFDIVITTNAGFPLDINLYQSVKGMSAAAQIVREGGAIIIAAECRDGIPDGGGYARILREAGTPAAVLHRISRRSITEQDQWQAQKQALIQRRAAVYVYSRHLSREQVESCLLTFSPSIETTLTALLGEYGREARICILPEGPQTIPYIC